MLLSENTKMLIKILIKTLIKTLTIAVPVKQKFLLQIFVKQRKSHRFLP